MPSRRSARPLTDRPSFLLSQLGYHSAATFTERLAELDLHPRQFGMLVQLSAVDGVTQQQLADVLGIHRNVMVGLVDELEQRGLVERRRHPVDRRAHAVHLTAAARSLLPDAERRADRNDRDLCAPLNATERRTLIELLTRMSEHAGLTSGVHPGLQHRDRAPTR